MFFRGLLLPTHRLGNIGSCQVRMAAVTGGVRAADARQPKRQLGVPTRQKGRIDPVEMRPNGYDQHGSPLQSATPQTHTGPLDMVTAQTGTIGKQSTGLLPRTGTRQG